MHGAKVKIDNLVFFLNLSRNFKLHKNLTRVKSTVHKDKCTFVLISHRILLRNEKCSRQNL
jgi:hypothetical protein